VTRVPDAEAAIHVDAVVRGVLDPLAPTAVDAPVDLEAVAPPSGWSMLRFAVVTGGALGVAALAASVVRHGSPVWRADEAVHAWVLAHRGVVDEWCARLVTWGGATTVALPALVLAGAVAGPGRRDVRTRLGAGMLLGASGALGVWLGLVINGSIGRGRPPAADWWTSAGGPAFPSGHTTTATIVAGLGAWALMARADAPRARVLLWSGAAACAGLVGWSRFWLGVHWPSDVVGGWLLGAAWVALVAILVTAARRRRGRTRSGPISHAEQVSEEARRCG
jgi:membrane-associated phospholipid phosphatase